MKYLLTALALVLTTACCKIHEPHVLTSKEIAFTSVCRIGFDADQNGSIEGGGSGIVVNSKQMLTLDYYVYILTAKHVVEPFIYAKDLVGYVEFRNAYLKAPEDDIRDLKGKTFLRYSIIEIIAYEAADAALVVILSEVDIPAIQVSESNAKFNDDLTVIGYPALIGPFISEGKASVSSKETTIISNLTTGGVSGAGVLKNNKLVGIMVATVAEPIGFGTVTRVNFLTIMLDVETVREWLCEKAKL